jgi:hypothetical protein
MRRDAPGGDFQRQRDLSRARTRVLSQIRRDVVLGDLLGRSLAEEHGSRRAKALAFSYELLVRGQLLIECAKALIDLSDYAARCSADLASAWRHENTTSIR